MAEEKPKDQTLMDWHKWFRYCLKMYLLKYGSKDILVKFEHILENGTYRADCVVYASGNADIWPDEKLFFDMGRVNALELKGPDDTVDVDVFWKTIIYLMESFWDFGNHRLFGFWKP